MPKTVDHYEGAITRKLLLKLAVQQRPIIIVGLFDDQPIRQIESIADLPPSWANRRVQPRVPAERINYPGKNLTETTVSRFLTDREAGFVLDSLSLPPTGAPIIFPEAIVRWGSSENPLLYYMGNPGAFTHLHFDANGLHNLHYQLLGKKRFFLFPESRSKYLAPQQQSSRIYMERISKTERIHFTDYAGGYCCTLEPGDSLFVPAQMWHYVEYEEPGLSLSTRFGRSQHIQNLMMSFGGLHSTVEFQHVAAGLIDDENILPIYKDAYQQILETVGNRYNFSRVQEKLEELCQQLCPEKVECLYGNWQDNSLAID